MRVIILSGLPGSGKTTHAQREFPGATVVSADDYFICADGTYYRDAKMIGLAHQDCWRKFYAAVTRGDQVIVVDNTNITTSEIAPYVLPAQANGYTVEIITFRVSIEMAEDRNIHGVKRDALEVMERLLNGRILPRLWQNTEVKLSSWTTVTANV